MSSKLSKLNFNDYKPLREVIFASLREAIVEGELAPGERLLEVKLSEKMGVSRTPVREAIRMLELEGLVVMVPRKGAHVAEVTVKDIGNVLEVRAALDGLATSLSTQRITEEEIAELHHIQKQFVSFVDKGDLQGSIKKDVEFHDFIYKTSKNEKLTQIAGNLWEQVQRFRVIYMRDTSNAKEIIKEHDEILDAISSQDYAKARLVAQKHIKKQEEKIIAAINRDDE